MSNNINTTAINTTVTAALRAAHTYGARIDELRSLLRGVQREDAQNAITPAVGKFYNVSVTEGQRGLTFDKDAPQYEAARKARQSIIKAVYGSASAHKEPAVKRFDRQRIEAIQAAIAGMEKDEARAYFKRVLEVAFAK
jgi:hypothetical protein